MSGTAADDILTASEAGCPLVLIRHGPTDWTDEGRLQGRADPPLSNQGRKEVCSWRLPEAVGRFVWQASPLQRAVETADLLAPGLAALEPCLMEMDWGDWEGHRLVDLRRDGGAAMAALEARGLDLLPPGGESPRMVQDRLRPWLRIVGAAGRPAAAVTHKGVIRAIIALATGWDMRGPAPARVGMGMVQCFRVTPQGAVTALRLDWPCVPPA